MVSSYSQVIAAGKNIQNNVYVCKFVYVSLYKLDEFLYDLKI